LDGWEDIERLGRLWQLLHFMTSPTKVLFHPGGIWISPKTKEKMEKKRKMFSFLFFQSSAEIIVSIRSLERLGQFHQHFFEKLLQAKIPAAQKYSVVISVFLYFWDLHS